MRLLAILKTEVQSVITVVLDIVNISGFVNRGAPDIDRGILHRGCRRFQKPRCSEPKLWFHRNVLTRSIFP
jgi:hypothetical protein